MSDYWEANGTAQGVSFEEVRQDIEGGVVEGISVAKGAENSDDCFCVTDGKNFVWIYEPCCFGVGLGLKRWGGNDGTEILERLEEHYGLKFLHESELGICHIG